MSKDKRDASAVIQDARRFNEQGIVYGSGDAYEERRAVKRLLKQKQSLSAADIDVLEEARSGLVEAARKQDLRDSASKKIGRRDYEDNQIASRFNIATDKPNGDLDVRSLEIKSMFADLDGGAGVPDKPSNATSTVQTDRDYHGKGPTLRQPKGMTNG